MKCNTELGVGLKNCRSFTAAESPDWKLSNPSFCSTDWYNVIYLRTALHEHYTMTLVLNRRKVFSHSTAFITFQSGRSLASLSPLSLPVISLTVQEKLYDGKTPLPFPGSLGKASRSSKSCLFVSGTILTGCQWEAKMSTSFPAAAGAAH